MRLMVVTIFRLLTQQKLNTCENVPIIFSCSRNVLYFIITVLFVQWLIGIFSWNCSVSLFSIDSTSQTAYPTSIVLLCFFRSGQYKYLLHILQGFTSKSPPKGSARPKICKKNVCFYCILQWTEVDIIPHMLFVLWARECPTWCYIAGATVTVHQFFCILHSFIFYIFDYYLLHL